jgi:hypothetical protein
MEDLRLIRELGTALDPDGPVPHDRMRARVVAGVTGAAGPQLGRRRGPRRRPIVWVVPLVAAAALAGIITIEVGPSGNQAPGPGVTAPRADPTTPDAGQSVVNLDARTILLAAAERAGKERSTVPAAGSFVYSRFTGVGVEIDQETKKEGTRNSVHESWYSVDGKQPGLSQDTQDGFYAGTYTEILATCPGPVIPDANKNGISGPYCDGPGYVADVPTSAAGALKYLRSPRAWTSWVPFLDGRLGSAAQRATDDQVVSNAWTLLGKHQLSPASREAVFGALAALPGMQVVPEAEAADGRTGVAVVWAVELEDDAAVRDEMIFDREDHAIIGYRSIVNDPAHGVKDRVDINLAVAEKVVVPTVGVRPDGSKIERGGR